MGATPDQLRAEVEARRAHLAHNVDLLADRVAPGRVAHRTSQAAHRRLTGIKERVMGSAHDTTADRTGTGSIGDRAGQIGGTAKETTTQMTATVKDTAAGIGEAVQDAPSQVRRRTQGSPLAAGIMAFGAGLLAAALLPTSQAEEQAAAKLREHAGDVLEPAKQAALEAVQEVRDELREPAAEAVESVKATAQDAVQTSKATAQDTGRQAADDLRNTGQTAVQEVRRPMQ
ncbi:hypothetical protein KCMC57_up60520 [Kitasatospora sp. CMC57]|uniref:DUF3618 domain-containing protein n=1 Tax=Kitasatospora sp. CMC57 TaxID=3231513 RepID=A0AB33K2A3_9ACTN